MRTILLAASALLVTGAAGAAEPTRLDAAQLDWITASTASAPIAVEAARAQGTGFDILDAARGGVEAALDADAATTVAGGGGKAPADGAIAPIVGGGTMAVATGTGGGSVGFIATETITSTADGKGPPIITRSTGSLGTGDFANSLLAGPPAALPTTAPTVVPTTASLGVPAPMSLLGGFSAMPVMPSFSLGSGG